MSVKAVSLRGRPTWQVQVWRDGGAFNRRRYLDRKHFLKQDALAVEAELLAEYEESKEARCDSAGAEILPLPSPQAAIEITEPKTTTTRTEKRTRARTRTRAKRPAAGQETSSRAEAPSVPTFAELAERYLQVQDQTRSDFKNKARNVRLHLMPLIGEVPIDKIGRREVDSITAHLRTPKGEVASSRRSLGRKEAPISARRKGGTRSPKTINNILGTLRAVLALAHEYEVIDRVPRIRREREEKRDPSFLDFEEAAAFIDATPAEHRALVRTLLRTGLRQGEAQELRWRDVHTDGGRPYVRVSRSVRRAGRGVFEVKTTKSRRPRSVPLSQDVVSVLRVLRGEAEDLVFPGDAGGYLKGDWLRRLLAETAKRAGLRKHVHPHMLRHTFASHASIRGVPLQVIQKWLGHANITTTQRYAHLRPDTGDELIELLAGPSEGAHHVVGKITNNTTNNRDPVDTKNAV